MCSEKSLKYSLVVVCIIIMLAGAAALAIGVWSVVGPPTVEPRVSADMRQIVSYVVIGGGVGAVVISLLGCCGAVRGNKCKLRTFAIILFIPLAVMLWGAAVAFGIRQQVDDTRLYKHMFNSITKYGEDTALRKMWDWVQNYFQCCGLRNSSNDDSYAIWSKMNRKFASGDSVPDSCCKIKDKFSIQECQKSPSTETYNVDCYDRVKEFLKEHAHVVAGLAAAVCFVSVVGIVVSCILYCRMK